MKYWFAAKKARKLHFQSANELSINLVDFAHAFSRYLRDGLIVVMGDSSTCLTTFYIHLAEVLCIARQQAESPPSIRLVSHELAGKGKRFCVASSAFVPIPRDASVVSSAADVLEGVVIDEQSSAFLHSLDQFGATALTAVGTVPASPTLEGSARNGSLLWVVPRLVTNADNLCVPMGWLGERDAVLYVLFVNTDLVDYKTHFRLADASSEKPKLLSDRGNSGGTCSHTSLEVLHPNRLRYHPWCSGCREQRNADSNKQLCPAVALHGLNPYCRPSSRELMQRIEAAFPHVGSLLLPAKDTREEQDAAHLLRLCSHREENLPLLHHSSVTQLCASATDVPAATRRNTQRMAVKAAVREALSGQSAVAARTYYPTVTAVGRFLESECCLSDLFVFEFARELTLSHGASRRTFQCDGKKAEACCKLYAAANRYYADNRSAPLVHAAILSLPSLAPHRQVVAWDSTDPVEMLPRISLCLSYEVYQRPSNCCLPTEEATLNGALRCLILSLRTCGWVLVHQEDHHLWERKNSFSHTPATEKAIPAGTSSELWQAALVPPSTGLSLYIGASVAAEDGRRGVVVDFIPIPAALFLGCEGGIQQTSSAALISTSGSAGAFLSWEHARQRTPTSRWRPGLPAYATRMERILWPVVRLGVVSTVLVLPSVNSQVIVRYPSMYLVPADQQNQLTSPQGPSPSSAHNSPRTWQGIQSDVPRTCGDKSVTVLKLPLQPACVDSVESLFLASAQRFYSSSRRPLLCPRIGQVGGVDGVGLRAAQASWADIHVSRWQCITGDTTCGGISATPVPLGSRRCLLARTFVGRPRFLRCALWCMPDLTRIAVDYPMALSLSTSDGGRPPG